MCEVLISLMIWHSDQSSIRGSWYSLTVCTSLDIQLIIGTVDGSFFCMNSSEVSDLLEDFEKVLEPTKNPKKSCFIWKALLWHLDLPHASGNKWTKLVHTLLKL